MTARTFTLTAAEQRRIDRIDQLVVLGDAGVAELLAAVADSSWTVRRAAVAGLASLGDDAVPALCGWLATARTSEHEIAAVVDALSASLGAGATPAVVKLLEHPVAAVAADAASILGRRHATEATSALAAALRHLDDNVAVAAIEALGALAPTGAPPGAIEPLIAVIETRGFFRTFPALQVLARTGDPRAVLPIAALVGDPLFQLEAIRALGRTGSTFAIDPLTAALHGAEIELVRTVALALADLLARADWAGAGGEVVRVLRPAISPAFGQLAAALPGGDAVERIALATVLGRAGDASTLPILTGLLDDPAIRETAIAGIKILGHEVALLAPLGDGDPEITTALLPLVSSSRDAASVRSYLGDQDSEIRARACEALARLGDTRAVPALFDALADRNPRVAIAAAGAIQALHSAETGPHVIVAMMSGTAAVKRQALRIVAYLGLVDAFDIVLEATRDPDRQVAELAIAALGSLPDDRADPVLAGLAASPEPTLRAAVMRAWSHRADRPEFTAALLEVGLADPDAWVRYYAAQALGRIEHLASTPLLLARLADEMPHVRVAAIEALAHLDSEPARRALEAAAHSDDPDERRAALVGLARAPRYDALPVLLDAATSPDLATRLVAISGLALQPGGEGTRELARAARDSDTAVRDAAISLLADRDERDAVVALIDVALGSPLDHPAHAALSRPSSNRIAGIADELRDASDHTAAILTAALARMADPRATAVLFDALVAPNPSLRAAAAGSLIAINAEGAHSAVARLASEDADSEVRRLAAALVRARA